MKHYNWDWSVIGDNLPAFGNGLLKTLELTFISILLGTILGIGAGMILASKNSRLKDIKVIIRAITDSFRALPILILILLFSYWLPPIIGIHSSFLLAILALSLNLTAFIADVVRAAMLAVPDSYIKAGFALGMTNDMILRRIILPDAIRHILPTIALLYIDVLKMSSIASVIAVKELTHMSTLVSSTQYRYLEVFAFLAVIYLLLILPFSIGVRRLERSKWFLKRI